MTGAGDRLTRAELTLIGIALAIGVGLRLRVYLANRSLWLDEAFLAINIIERDFAGLMRPLAWDQAAPLGFLFLERLMVLFFGTSEYALRAIPLAAGIGTLFLFWRLASTVLYPIAVIVGIAILSLAEPLIYYSNEVKQYAVDAAITIILWIAFIALDKILREDRLEAWAAAGLLGGLAVWFSHPALFIIGGIGLRWLWLTVRRFHLWSLLVRAPAGLLWALSFALSYVVALRPVAEGTRLHDMWQFAAAPLLPTSLTDLQWYVGLVWTLAQAPFGSGMAKVVALVCGVGVVVLWYRHRDLFWWAVGALALAIVASSLGQYPRVARLWIFVTPITVLLVALAIDEVWRQTRHRLRFLGLVLVLAMLVPSVITGMSLAAWPPEKEEIRPVLQYVRADYMPGDRLYLYASARAPAKYYAARGLVFPGEVVHAVAGRGDRSAYKRDLAPLRGKGRTWIVFSHVRRSGGVDEEALILGVLDEFGVRLAERRETGASAYLYAL